MKSNLRRFLAHVRRNRRLKQRIMALRADNGAVLTDSLNMARILAKYYASVYRTDEGRDHPSLPEPLTIMNAPRFTSAAVHKELSTLDTAKGSGPDDLHPFTLQILAEFLPEPSPPYITNHSRVERSSRIGARQSSARFSKSGTRRTRPTTAL